MKPIAILNVSHCAAYQKLRSIHKAGVALICHICNKQDSVNGSSGLNREGSMQIGFDAPKAYISLLSM